MKKVGQVLVPFVLSLPLLLVLANRFMPGIFPALHAALTAERALLETTYQTYATEAGGRVPREPGPAAAPR